LLGVTELTIYSTAPKHLERLVDTTCAVFGLPHGQAMEIAPNCPSQVNVIDLSGDSFERPQMLSRGIMDEAKHHHDGRARACYGPDGNGKRSDPIEAAHRTPGCLRRRRAWCSTPWWRTISWECRVIVDAKTALVSSWRQGGAQTLSIRRDLIRSTLYRPSGHSASAERSDRAGVEIDRRVDNELVFMRTADGFSARNFDF